MDIVGHAPLTGAAELRVHAVDADQRRERVDDGGGHGSHPEKGGRRSPRAGGGRDDRPCIPVYSASSQLGRGRLIP